MKNQFKNILIIALIVLIGLFGIFGGKKVSKYTEDIKSLKSDKTILESQNMLLESKVKSIEAKVKIKDRKIDSCMAAFKKKDKVIAGIAGELTDALDKLKGITADSSYQFLQKVAYDYPGALRFLFNELQVHYIHADYLKARNSEKIIPVYQQQIENCKLQFSERDSVENGLKEALALKDQSLANCEKINEDNDTIIKDTEKQRDKERHRKNFWRFTTAVMTATTIILSVFGL